jgi:hypothetical protein
MFTDKETPLKLRELLCYFFFSDNNTWGLFSANNTTK